MNFLEAIKSGRPFRRKCWNWPRDAYLRNDGPFLSKYRGDERIYAHFPPSPTDLLACDWEVREPAVTITESLFWGKGRAAIKAVEERTGYRLLTRLHPPAPQDIDVMVELARQLGLKDD